MSSGTAISRCDMDRCAQAAGNTVADRAQRIVAAELAETQVDKLHPAGKPLCSLF